MDLDRVKDAFLGNKERLVTGLGLLAVVVVVAIVNNFYVMWGLFALISAVSVYEMQNLLKIDNLFVKYDILVATILIWILGLFLQPLFLIALVGVVLGSGLVAYKNIEVKPILIFIYPVLPIALMLDLYVAYGISSLLLLIVVVAGTDSFAYFTGKSIGKTKFCETSPNKTWEGIAGGVLFGTIFGSLVGLTLLEFKYALLVSFVVAISSVLGDLFESYLKRRADVKDSGNILPGHGGVLDRMDGYLFAVVVLYSCLVFVI